MTLAQYGRAVAGGGGAQRSGRPAAAGGGGAGDRRFRGGRLRADDQPDHRGGVRSPGPLLRPAEHGGPLVARRRASRPRGAAVRVWSRASRWPPAARSSSPWPRRCTSRPCWPGAGCRCTQARFPHARPADEAPYRRLFGPGLRWKAGEAALVIPRSALELPLVKADPHLAAYFEAQAEALVRQGQVETVLPLAARCGGGSSRRCPRVPRRCRRWPERWGRARARCGGTWRTRGRRSSSWWSRSGRSWRSQHLEDPRLTASEIAFLVGFSELSPFLRAFRRWTGLTPGEYRQRDKGPARAGRRAALHSRPAKAR